MKELLDDKTFIVRYFHISYYKNNGESSLKMEYYGTVIICTKKWLDRPEVRLLSVAFKRASVYLDKIVKKGYCQISMINKSVSLSKQILLCTFGNSTFDFDYLIIENLWKLLGNFLTYSITEYYYSAILTVLTS